MAGQAAYLAGISPRLTREYYQVTGDRDQYAPALYIAGWYYGVTEIDAREEIVKCFQTNDDLTFGLYDGMEDWIVGNKNEGDIKMNELKPLWKQALANCGDIGDEITEQTEIAKEFWKPGKNAEVASQIYDANINEIEELQKNQLYKW